MIVVVFLSFFFIDDYLKCGVSLEVFFKVKFLFRFVFCKDFRVK